MTTVSGKELLPAEYYRTFVDITYEVTPSGLIVSYLAGRSYNLHCTDR